MRMQWLGGSGGMPPRNFFGILDVLRSILLLFGHFSIMVRQVHRIESKEGLLIIHYLLAHARTTT